MPTTQPRLNVVLEPPLYEVIKDAAARDGLSLSTKARDLIRLAVEMEEDVALEALVAERMKDPGEPIPHDAFWKEAKKRRKKRAR